MKIRLFVSKVESNLLYGSETWTLNESFRRERFDVCYTRISSRMAFNVDWKQQKTKFKRVLRQPTMPSTATKNPEA